MAVLRIFVQDAFVLTAAGHKLKTMIYNTTILVKIIRMGNMHFPCHFLSVFMASKLAIGEPKNYPVDKYTNESLALALLLLQADSI